MKNLNRIGWYIHEHGLNYFCCSLGENDNNDIFLTSDLVFIGRHISQFCTLGQISLQFSSLSKIRISDKKTDFGKKKGESGNPLLSNFTLYIIYSYRLTTQYVPCLLINVLRFTTNLLWYKNVWNWNINVCILISIFKPTISYPKYLPDD